MKKGLLWAAVLVAAWYLLPVLLAAPTFLTALETEKFWMIALWCGAFPLVMLGFIACLWKPELEKLLS